MVALTKEVYALAAAHGLTEAIAGTWHEGLARSPRVLVPIQVDALPVRTEGGTWADCRMTPPVDGTDNHGPDLLATPFAELGARRDKGVYLHWALPDALTRGVVSATDPKVAFPAVPDRWLVLRLSAGSLSRRAVRGWVLEADGATPTVHDLDGWVEASHPDSPSVAGDTPLTALGHGDAAWAGYFDNVEGRLAFYDRLDGIDGPLAYLVCGWHSRHADDPIGEGLASRSHFEQRLAELRWEVSGADLDAAFRYTDDKITAAAAVGLPTREARYVADRVGIEQRAMLREPLRVFDAVAGAQKADVNALGIADKFLARPISWPEFTLYHGAVVGIGWPGVGLSVAPDGLLGGLVGGPPVAADITVGLGNTSAEALAAMLGANTGRPEQARLLEAALLGAMNEADEPDGAARLDARLHSTGFASLPGGEGTETITERNPTTPVSHVADPGATKPGVFTQLGPTHLRVTESLEKSTRATGFVRASNRVVQTKAAAPTIATGRLDASLKYLDGLGITRPAVVDPSPRTTTVKRALPRFFVPADPVFVLQGAGRSFKHGHDGVHSDNNRLACRLSGHTVTSLAPRMAANLPAAGHVGADDLLERGVGSGSVPQECEDLLRELALLDPGSADVAVRATSRGVDRLATRARVDLARVYAVEQVAWWVSRDPRRDVAPLIAASGFTGMLPSPMAISPPSLPWVPLHLDWEIELLPQADFTDWALHEIDFDAVPERLPTVGAAAAQTLTGRALLTGGAAKTAAAAVRQVVEAAQRSGGSQSLPVGKTITHYSNQGRLLALEVNGLKAGAKRAAASHQDDLDHLADELDRMDVLVGALDRFNTLLRAGLTADGTTAPAKDTAVPAGFSALRAGFMRVKRLRLVDCFGQVLDLLGSDAQTDLDMAKLVRSEPLTVAARTDLVELAPRFTAPSRLWFRFVSATDDTVEATDAVSPVCGYVLPNHLDGDLQFYADDGAGLGAVRVEAGTGIVWEDAPGRPTTVGKLPAHAMDNATLAGVAQGLLDWGIADASPDAPATDTALSSLLRTIDATLWSVDPFAHVGEEHLALLVGHPVAVLRGSLRLEVDEPVTPGLVHGLRVPVRIGALAHWQDGLLAYFVDDDYTRLYLPDPACADFARPIGPGEGFQQQASATSGYYNQFAADLGVVADPGATPVDHPYVDTSGVLWVQPGQQVKLTMLMEPHAVVHATTGYLPRKEIGMRREWVATGLAHLAPVFRFGPVLVDPKTIRMPVASNLHGTWSWSHRADATTWLDQPVTNSTADAQLPANPSAGQEGWLTLSPEQEKPS